MKLAQWTAILVLAAAVFPASVSGGKQKPMGQLDLNRATLAQLMRLDGMTAIWAQRILRFRPYRSKLELLDQGVLSREVYLRIHDQIVVHRSK